jgi:UDP:flavonoid glycosyltransferase YjiC (YdhE family)
MASFLFATVPVPAHARNALPFAARLVERGHDVRWLASRRFHASITAVGATALPHDEMRDFDGTRLAEEFPQLGGSRGPRFIGRLYADVLVGEAPARVADLRRVIESQPVDAMLCDGLSYGVSLLGEALDVPVATFGDGPVPRAHGATPAYGPGLLPMRGPLSRLRNHAVRSASRWWVFGEAQRRYDCLREDLGLSPDGRSLIEASVSPLLHLQGCTPSFEYAAADLPPTVHWVGALRPDLSTDWEPPPWWDEVRSSTRRVVHVTQGSIRPDMGELVAPTIRALADEDVLVVVTTGGVTVEALEASLGGRVPDNVRVAPFVPYDVLLPHVDVCVTNGGYTGVTAALHSGVPLVQAGSTEEKAEIGARITWSGVGTRIRATRPSPRRVAAAVHRVLGDRAYAIAAGRMADEMRAHDAGQEGAELLERLAATRHPVTEPVTPAHVR